jgi:putative transposase
MEAVSYSHSCGQCAYHIVVVPYKRRKIFYQPALQARMEEIFRAIACKHKWTLHALKVNADHVHIFIGVPPTLSLSDLFRILKGLSSHLFFEKMPKMREHLQGRLWSKGKFFRSVGSVTDNAVQYYIEHQ